MSRDTLRDPATETIDNTSEDTIPIKKSGKFEDSALTETVDEVQSSKTIRANITAPTGSIGFEDSSILSTNSDTLEIEDCVRNDHHEIITELYDDTGSSAPYQSQKGLLQEFQVQLLDDDQSDSFEVVFPTLNNVHWKEIIIKAREDGTGIFTIRADDENGCILNTETKFIIGIGQGNFAANIPVEIPLKNRIKLYAGQQIWVKYEGPAIAGHNFVSDPIWGTQFVPYVKTMSQPFEDKDIALVEDIPEMGDVMEKSVYDPGNIENDAFNRANHIGVQPASTISDFDTEVENNSVVDANATKLSGIESGAEVNPYATEVKSLYESNSDTNAFTDSEKTKLAGLTGAGYKGVFADLAALQATIPIGSAGDSATVTSPNGNLFYWNITSWDDTGTGFHGNMIKVVYDPTAKNADAFSMDSMVETATKKILSDLERSEIAANTGDVTLDTGQTTQDSLDLTGQEVKANLATQTTDGIMSKQDKIELDNISANGAGDGWISGLDVVENSPKGTIVLYGAGTYLINGSEKSIASSGSYDLANGFGAVDHYSGMTNDQHALVTIYVDNAEVIKSIRGDVGEKGNTIFPALQPADTVCVAFVEIKVNSDGTPKDIDNKHIFDCRTSPSINTDETVSVSVDDQSTGYLIDKLSNNGNVTFTLENAGGVETIKADAPGGGSSVPPSILHAGTTDIDGLDVTSLYPSGILWIDSTADIAVKSLQNGQDKQIIRVASLSLNKMKILNNTGTYESIMVEGNADVIADKYGGATLIFNASKGNWYFMGIN